MKSRIRIARGTSAARSVSTEVPAEGQPVYETDTRALYVGDGTTQLKNLKPVHNRKEIFSGGTNYGANFPDNRTITFTEGINNGDSVEFLLCGATSNDLGAIAGLVESPYIFSKCRFYINRVNQLVGAAELFYLAQVGSEQGLKFTYVLFNSATNDTTNVTTFNVEVAPVFVNATGRTVNWGSQNVSIHSAYKILD